MKENIVPQMECIDKSISRNVPAFRNAWFNFQVIIQLNQPVKDLVYSPYISLVTGISRVKGGYSGRFIVSENCLPVVFKTP
jgi:hypothetical protein